MHLYWTTLTNSASFANSRCVAESWCTYRTLHHHFLTAIKIFTRAFIILSLLLLPCTVMILHLTGVLTKSNMQWIEYTCNHMVLDVLDDVRCAETLWLAMMVISHTHLCPTVTNNRHNQRKADLSVYVPVYVRQSPAHSFAVLVDRHQHAPLASSSGHTNATGSETGTPWCQLL